jgi:phosphomannomutase
LVKGTLSALGINVTDIGLTTTPTVEIAVTELKADAGIIITASHNPMQWNALKLLNKEGEFISADDGQKVLKLAEKKDISYAIAEELGRIKKNDSLIEKHIEKILELDLVDVEAIKKAKFKVVIDCVNSTGGLAIPLLLDMLGVKQVTELFCEPTGHFPHNPEPLPENLDEIAKEIVRQKAHVGFVVDPDVDRLAIVMEDGEMFGEEYTLVAVADYVLQNTKNGNTVSNLSSTQALKEVTEKHGGKHTASAVGEVNVVEEMKKTKAIIGGEGNGGIIYPEFHYGRDALVGIALFLSFLAKSGKSCSALRGKYPAYTISKNKVELSGDIDVDKIMEMISKKYSAHQQIKSDGVKILFDKEWVHLRKSNTEPIIRIYSESDSEVKAESLARKIMQDISEILRA